MATEKGGVAFPFGKNYHHGPMVWVCWMVTKILQSPSDDVDIPNGN